jgi:hypothetical protein
MISDLISDGWPRAVSGGYFWLTFETLMSKHSFLRSIAGAIALIAF